MSLRSSDQHSLLAHRTGDEAAQDSALRGATLAFKSTPSPSKALTPNYSGANGALAAATKAGLSGAKSTDNRRGLQATSSVNDSKGQYSLKAGRDAFARKSGSPFDLHEPTAATEANRRQSPSHLAATRAAARATPAPMSRESTGTIQSSRARNTTSQIRVQNDESPIPATNQLVELFEAKHQSKGPENDVRASRTTRIVSPVPIRPPVSFLHARVSNDAPAALARRKPPPRNSSKRASTGNPVVEDKIGGAKLVKPVEQGAMNIPVSQKAKTVVEAAKPRTSATKQMKSQLQASLKEGSPKRKSKVAPFVPPPRRTKSIHRASASTEKAAYKTNNNGGSDSDSSTASYASAREAFPRTNTISQSPLVSRTNTLFQKSAEDTFHEAESPLPPPKPFSLQTTGPAETSPPPMPPRRPSPALSTSRLTPRDLGPGLTAQSLANAMVASSLASSRAPSPTKNRPIPPPPRRQGRHQSFGFLTTSPPASRVPSPLKSLRQTLRPAPGSSSDEEPKSRKSGEYKRDQHHHLLKRKHPNKHAEGDRKRWRDVVTEEERRRYEGVWAANRGARVQIAGTGSDEVHGYVVKDIWKRSGLSSTVLEQVWELVADFGRGNSRRRILRKEEFVVGMWLVDQCLKGRKLPVKVGDSVWESVRKLLGGIRAR